MDLEKVVPNTFGLTNSPWVGQDNLPGLNYFINAKQVPFHRDWYEMLKDWAKIPRFGGALTATGLGRFNGFEWLRNKTELERDELYHKGYNYVGHVGAYGVVCWGHNVTLPGGKTFVPLTTALVSVALLRELDAIAAIVNRAAVGSDPHYLGQMLAYNFSGVVDEALAQRLLYLPSDAPHNGVRYNQAEGCVDVCIQHIMKPDLGTMRVYPTMRIGPTVVEVAGALANLPDLLDVLYLPGTMEFKNLRVVVKP